jgi:ferredoxin
MDDQVKTFHDLRKEVQQHHTCGKCGGCVSFCSADNLGALKGGQDGVHVLQMRRSAFGAASGGL